MKCLMVFGSTSDKETYSAIEKELSSVGILVNTEIASAHRHPEKLMEFLNNREYDFVVAGAGLAAHLPGVVASKTEVPVIGVPVDSQYQGLDAFLSVLQMPAGIPVLTAPIGKPVEIAKFVRNFGENKATGICVVRSEEISTWPEFAKEWDRINAWAQKLGLALSQETQGQAERINIVLRTLDESPQESAQLEINCPFVRKNESQSLETVPRLFKLASTSGLWVGTNNLRNAFLAAIQVSKLDEYKEFLRPIKKGEWS
jgi:5-(carboxyamino)imidazole ribonucleotide mutase